VIDPLTRIAAERIAKITPKRIDPLARVSAVTHDSGQKAVRSETKVRIPMVERSVYFSARAFP
jgi:hypothetical protein